MNFKYIERQLEPIAKQVAQTMPEQTWSNYIAVPLCGEDEHFPKLLRSFQKLSLKGRCLFVIIINESSDTPIELKSSNQTLINQIHTAFNLQAIKTEQAEVSFYFGDSYDFIQINCTQEYQFTKKGGVGLARKILGDLGLLLFSRRKLLTNWLHFTDGDAQLPSDYFTQTLGINGSAFIYNFKHVLDRCKKTWAATKQYEESLNYYVAGLKFAKSPYAFHTVGSTLAIDASAYSYVHGFPKRSAGEDFYLLNKLAKIGQIVNASGQPILLASRKSDRVPFGTAKSSENIAKSLSCGQNHRVYHPNTFELIRSYIKLCLNALALEETKSEAFITYFKEKLNSADLSEDLVSHSETIKAINEAIIRGKTIREREKQFHNWFDAFKTMKMVHRIRDRSLPLSSIEHARKHAPFPTNIGEVSSQFDPNPAQEQIIQDRN